LGEIFSCFPVSDDFEMISFATLTSLHVKVSLMSRSPEPWFEISVLTLLTSADVLLLRSAIFLDGGGGMMKAEISSRGSTS